MHEMDMSSYKRFNSRKVSTYGLMASSERQNIFTCRHNIVQNVTRRPMLVVNKIPYF